MGEKSNCLFYALRRFWRDGGYLMIRRSRTCRGGWHWLWSPVAPPECEHYVPWFPRRKWWRAAIHKLWYRGRVRRGDEE